MFYCVLLGFTGFYYVVLGFTRLYRVELDFYFQLDGLSHGLVARPPLLRVILWRRPEGAIFIQFF